MSKSSLRIVAAALAATAIVALAGCSSESGTPPATADGADGRSVAYLNFSVVNVYDKPIQDAAQAAADKAGVKMTVFDGKADGGAQFNQLQNVITAGTYDGVIIQAVQSTNLIPLIKEATAQGIAVVIVDQVVGEDLSTNEPQVDGIVASVTIPPVQVGKRLGELAIQSCTEASCDAAFIYGYKGSVTDDGLAQGFADAIAGSKVTMAAEGQGSYTTEGGLEAAQNILTSNPDVDIMVAADQTLLGAEQAIASAGRTGEVTLIGYNGSTPALAKIKEGAWFGGVQYPQKTAGREAMEAMVDYFDTGATPGAIELLANQPHDNLITKDTVDDFHSEDQ